MSKISENATLKRLRNSYRLVIMNDDTYEEVVTFKLTRLSVYVAMSSIFVLLVCFTIAFIVFTPLKYYVPGYGSKNSKTELQLLKIKTDSLEQAMQNKDMFLDGMKKVLQGNTPTIKDTVTIDVPKQEISND